METENLEKLVKIKERMDEYRNLILKHGINVDHEIFIEKELSNILTTLDKIEESINDEKK